ncbi:MAG: porin family protein [Candidatus Zixiibacteriota bacterium]
MKKLITFSVLLIALWCVSAFPAAAFPRLDYGAKIGLNATGLLGSDVDKTSFPKKGLVGGGLVRWNMSPGIGLQVELLYSQRGSESSVSNFSLVDTLKIKLDYLEIPVLMRYELPLPGKVKPNLLFGPALAFKVSAKTTTDDNSSFYDSELEIMNARGTDFSIVLGAGVDIAFGKGLWQFEARYNIGLTKVFEDVSPETGIAEDEIAFTDNGEALDLKNGGFSFTIGYVF